MTVVVVVGLVCLLIGVLYAISPWLDKIITNLNALGL